MLCKTIFILFVVYFTAIEGQEREGWPGYNRFPEIKGWVKIHLEPADHDTARAKCREEGAHLLNPYTLSYIPNFKENLEKLVNTSSTAEKPILVVHSLAKVEYVSSQGFENVDGVSVYLKHYKINCLVFTPNGKLYRTECENKLPFVCCAFDTDALPYGVLIDQEPELSDSLYRYFNPNATSN